MASRTFVAILTYNEQKNITDCISSAKECGFDNIAVFDGGSTDDTVSIAKKMGVIVFAEKGSSISMRRGYGLQYACDNAYDYVFFVDADQRLMDKDTQGKVNAIFSKNKLVTGIQLNIVSPEYSGSFNYWQKGFYSRHALITADYSLKKVIGTPCFFRIDIVKDFKYNTGKINGPSDDTFFCKQINSKGFQLISTDIKCTEIVRASFLSTVRKAFWYGIGDAEYVINEVNSSDRKNHMFHVLIRNPLINPIRKWNDFFFFYLIFGFSRMGGFLYYYIFRPSKYLNKS